AGGKRMSSVRVLVGTRKGAFILSSDASRKSWKVDGPHFAGWEIYHLKASPVNPDRIYASQSSGWFGQVLQRSEDGRQTWEAAGNPERICAAVSAAGTCRAADAGASWRPINNGLKSNYIPDPDAYVGHCVHRIAMHPSRPNTLFMQKHWDVMRTDDGGENWREISGNLPTDFGFVIDINANEPDTVYVVPITSDSHHFVPDGKL